MSPARSLLVLRLALAVGFCIDAFVGAIALVAQPLLLPLFDIPVKDAATTTILGGELLVAAAVYAIAFRDPLRWQPLLWVCAFDQTLGVLLPALEIALGNVPATFKTIGPMPVQVLLVAVYVTAAVRRPKTAG